MKKQGIWVEDQENGQILFLLGNKCIMIILSGCKNFITSNTPHALVKEFIRQAKSGNTDSALTLTKLKGPELELQIDKIKNLKNLNNKYEIIRKPEYFPNNNYDLTDKPISKKTNFCLITVNYVWEKDRFKGYSKQFVRGYHKGYPYTEDKFSLTKIKGKWYITKYWLIIY